VFIARSEERKVLNGPKLDFTRNGELAGRFVIRIRKLLGKGSVKNNLVEFALEFAVDLIDLIEQNRRNSELFRGLL